MSVHFGSIASLCKESTSDQAGEIVWGPAVEIVNTIRKTALTSVGSGDPFKYVCVCVMAGALVSCLILL